MRRALVAALVLAAACGGKAKPAVTTIANQDTGGDAYGGDTYAGDDDDENCTETEGEIGRWVDDPTESASLYVCTGEQSSSSDEAAEEGFYTTAMTARLVATDADAKTLADTEILSWDNGWEWGADFSVLGSLDDGHGPRGLVVDNHGYDEAGVADTIQVWVVVDGAWTNVWEQSGTTVEVSIHDASMDLTVSEGSDAYDPDAVVHTTFVTVEYSDGGVTETSRTTDDDDSADTGD
jgi:hypothetical protein